MSKVRTVRNGLLGSAAVLAIMAAASGHAAEVQFGEVSITFDTTVSMGASMLTQERETAFLPEGNGGPIDPRNGPGGVIALTNSAVPDFTPLPFTGRFQQTANPDNYDGGINTDDGRLNFDKGDLIGANVKASHDLIVSWQNYRVFARAVGFYDVILSQKDAGERSLITDQAIGDVGRNYELLDLFLTADYTVADMPLSIRVGKQVINWGESTFILGGNNAFNPIDVGAFRRPGAEIKEALVPVNAVSASISLPFNVSLSGYYALDWEPFELDPSGTPFSAADIVALGSGVGGNEFRRSFLTGSPFSGMRRTCAADAAAFGNTALTSPIGIYNIGGSGFGLLRNPNVAQAGSLDCLDSPFVSASTPYTIGQHERIKQGLITSLASEGVTRIGQGLLSRDADIQPDEGGEFGLSARIYAEELNGTEFGFYYQNLSSRLPFLSWNSRIGEVHVGATPGSFQLATGQAGRFALPTGCLIDSSPGTFLDPRVALLGSVAVSDPENILNTTSASAAAALGITLFNSPTLGLKNMRAMMQLNCALAIVQSGTSPVTARPTLFDGAETLAYASDLGVFAEYPEDIEVVGFSFNTTLGSWGLQGDFTYRPEAPFQVDTDSMTIAAAAAACAFPAGTGDLAATFEALNTYAGTGCFARGTPGFQNTTLSGVLRNEMITAQIGTTAQFTGSDWFIEALGADIGTLVTEVGMVYVPGVEDTWLDKYDPDGFGPLNPTVLLQQYQNTGCQGTDLPLGGLLGLDRKSSAQCRPTDFSAGLVALFTIQYNNFLDTGFAVSPRLVYSYDFEGTTAAPYSNYLEDRQAINLGVDGTLNNNLRVGVSYSNFFGGHINNKSSDRDFAAISASYSF